MLLSFLSQLRDNIISLSLSLSVISTDRQRVVAGDEEDVEDRGGGQVAGQQAARVGEDRLGVDDRQAEEGDGPDPVEDLE